MENIKEIINQIKVDSIYGKKKHFNASQRKKKYHKRIGIAIIAISVFEGSALCSVLLTKNEIIIVFLLFLSFLVVLLGSIQTFFKFNIESQGHEEMANLYLVLSKRCKKLTSFIDNNLIDKNKIVNNVNEIEEEINKINNLASKYPTNKKDYECSRRGIKNGEETYLVDELNL